MVLPSLVTSRCWKDQEHGECLMLQCRLKRLCTLPTVQLAD